MRDAKELETTAPYNLETLSEHYLAKYYGKRRYKQYKKNKSRWFEEMEKCPKCFSTRLSKPSKTKHYKVCRNCKTIILIKDNK